MAVPLSTFDVVRGASLLRTRGRASEQIGLIRSPLPKYGDPGNLVSFSQLPHTRLTYHRTWETGLETEIRVADFSPAFFAPALPWICYLHRPSLSSSPGQTPESP
jgi:hypothetical protein